MFLLICLALTFAYIAIGIFTTVGVIMLVGEDGGDPNDPLFYLIITMAWPLAWGILLLSGGFKIAMLIKSRFSNLGRDIKNFYHCLARSMK